MKVPAGGVAWPSPLSPQQARVPFVLTPQVWKPPALTAVKVPAGGVDWPLPLSPQQASGAVRPHPAGVVGAGADRGEGARGRGGLAVAVVPPAGDACRSSLSRSCGKRRRPRSRPLHRAARWRSRRQRPRSAGRRRRPGRRGSGEGGRLGRSRPRGRAGERGTSMNALDRNRVRPRTLSTLAPLPTLGLRREPTTGGWGRSTSPQSRMARARRSQDGP